MDTFTLTKPANFSNSVTAQKTLITNYMTVANQTAETESSEYSTETIVDDVEESLFANVSALNALLPNLFVAVCSHYPLPPHPPLPPLPVPFFL